MQLATVIFNSRGVLQTIFHLHRKGTYLAHLSKSCIGFHIHLHVNWREDVNTHVTADDLESVVCDYAVLAETKGAEYASFFDALRKHTTTTQFVVIGSKELIAAALTFGGVPAERTILSTAGDDFCTKFRRRYHDFQVITDNVEGKHLGDINVREQSACEWLTGSFKAG